MISKIQIQNLADWNLRENEKAVFAYIIQCRENLLQLGSSLVWNISDKTKPTNQSQVCEIV